MRLRVEIDENLHEDEVLIRCRSLNAETIEIQKRVSEVINSGLRLAVTKGDEEYYLNLPEILFLETADLSVAVHTANQIYNVRLKLFELEEILPGNFIRVSKSSIINTTQIRSIRKNLAGASEVQFVGSNKRAFVSRSYFKQLMDKLEEGRLKK